MSMAIRLGLTRRKQEKMLISQLLPGKDLTTYIPSCCLRVQLRINLHLVADYSLPFGTLTVSEHPQLLGATKRKAGE